MKILITAPTYIPSVDGPQFADAPSFQDVGADTAHAVVRAGKAQYINKKDDPSKLGAFTASETFVKALEDAIAAEAAADKAKAKAGKADGADKPAA